MRALSKFGWGVTYPDLAPKSYTSREGTSGPQAAAVTQQNPGVQTASATSGRHGAEEGSDSSSGEPLPPEAFQSLAVVFGSVKQGLGISTPQLLQTFQAVIMQRHSQKDGNSCPPSLEPIKRLSDLVAALELLAWVHSPALAGALGHATPAPAGPDPPRGHWRKVGPELRHGGSEYVLGQPVGNFLKMLV